MGPQRAEGFRHRFLAFSMALHAAPLIVVPSLARPVASPPPTPNPVGVSLVYMPLSPTDAADERLVVREEGSEIERGNELTPDPRAILDPLPESQRVESFKASEFQTQAVSAEEAAARASSPPPETVRDAREAHESTERSPAQRAAIPPQAWPDSTSHAGKHEVCAYLAGVEVGAERVGARGEGQPTADTMPEVQEEQTVELAEHLLGEQPPAETPREAVVAKTMVAALPPTAAGPQRDPSDSHPHGLGLLPEAAHNRRGAQRTQQDREAAIERIRERIQRVMPLVYWSTARRDQRVGQAIVRFRLTSNGYVGHFELVDSSGDLDVDGAARAAVHLAEPYVYVPGWIELALAFRG